jgi:hypothetical protein
MISKILYKTRSLIKGGILISCLFLIIPFVVISAPGENPWRKSNPGGIHEIDSRTTFSIGGYFNANYLQFKNGLGMLDNDINDLNFNKGTGKNYSGGIMMEVSFYSSLSLQLRAGLCNNSGLMKTDYYLPFIGDKYFKTEHELKIELFYLTAELLCKYNLTRWLYLTGGASYGIPIKSNYQHSVKIISDEIEYYDHSAQKTFNKIKIENVEKRISVKAGIGFPITIIRDNLYLVPEFNAEMPLNKSIKNSDFKESNYYNALMGIMFEL